MLEQYSEAGGSKKKKLQQAFRTLKLSAGQLGPGRQLLVRSGTDGGRAPDEVDSGQGRSLRSRETGHRYV